MIPQMHEELIKNIRSIKQRLGIGVITTLNGTDHFLMNQLDKMEELVNKDFGLPAVRFAEAEMNISEEDRIHLKNTLALMNSMIKCGENHSEVSNEMLTKSFLILKPTHENES